MLEYFSDLLYQVDFKEKGQGFLYLLFEHKSYPSRDIAYQLLRYKMRIWEYASKEAAGCVPPVFPLVIYHGTAKWSVPLNFASLYQGPESIRPGLLDFSYYLVDLSTHTDQELKMWGLASLGVLLLKHIFRDDLLERLTERLGAAAKYRIGLGGSACSPLAGKDGSTQFRNRAPVMKTTTSSGHGAGTGEKSSRTALEFLEATLRYVGAATERVTVENFREALQEALADTGDPRMDRLIDQLVAEHLAKHQPKWFQEGMERGRQEGRQEGTASLTIRELTRKFGCLDSGLEARVRELPMEDLERLWEDLPELMSESSLTEWLGQRETAH